MDNHDLERRANEFMELFPESVPHKPAYTPPSKAVTTLNNKVNNGPPLMERLFDGYKDNEAGPLEFFYKGIGAMFIGIPLTFASMAIGVSLAEKYGGEAWCGMGMGGIVGVTVGIPLGYFTGKLAYIIIHEKI